ncbi:MAG: 50S ribosome-binding GTPase, partial [Hyphomicrobiales bacterium]|nr:50S ribosome-binding GTPase [Hyphomicrobiales bacterium]
RLHRDSRKRVPYPVVALVGYTNAGKSTLFNRLTGAAVFADDLLFATLDPTMRELALPGGSKIILSDTVGFISSLPTALIAAFRATLEEVMEADLILLVRDIADEESEAQLADVKVVLGELGIDSQSSETSLIEVWNKIDVLDADRAAELRLGAKRNEAGAICISAATGEGVGELLTAIEAMLNATHETLEVTIEPGEGALANWLHENAEILTREPGRRGEITYRVRLSPAKRATLSRRLETTEQKAAKHTLKQAITT